MSDETTLLPCPFREHKRKKLVIHHRKHRCLEDGLYAVKCEICGIRGPYALSEEKAVEKWNTRHVETCEPDEPDGWHKCPECGCVVGYWLLNDDSWTIYMDDYQIPFNACPNCGRRVTA